MLRYYNTVTMALPFRMSIWLCFLQKIWSIIRLSWNGGIEFGPMLSLLHVSYRLEEITTSQWRFCQLWNLVVCNWGFRPSWSTISVTSLVRLLFWLIPYICTGEQSFRCVSLWPYSAGTFQKVQRSTTCVRRTLFLFLLWLFFNFNKWEKTRFVCNAI